MMLVAFSLDDHAYALHLRAVERVVRIVEVTRLPDAPGIVVGIVNVRGQVIPVVDVRKRFLMPGRDPHLSDQLILARTSRRAVALIADAVSGVVECDEADVIVAEAILPGMEYVKGIAKLKDRMLLIHDLDRFLSLEEDRLLRDAEGRVRAHGPHVARSAARPVQ
jgi:purine-binding chemotaxis protein CheW